MKALRGYVPRALDDHRTREALAYRRYVAATMKRLGLSGTPDFDLRVWLREAGRSHLQLDRLHSQLEAALAKPNRRKEARRLERQVWKTRGQLLAIERRLEELARSTLQRRPRSGLELLQGEGRT